MKDVYAYIRVSTKKQGDGVSLDEQQKSIIAYAHKHNLKIVEWFEETRTAAKRNRLEFNRMIKHLKKGKADGFIAHKIDRISRNLFDWAKVCELSDKGIDVHCSHESLNFKERGGRLAADIQAVVASDYVRNLKQEAKKGLYGRLKQGIYPFNAPLGYVNNGRGNAKTPDPEKAEHIRTLFRLYTRRGYSTEQLVSEMYKRGLRNLRGNRVTLNGIITILKNQFYIGLMPVKGQIFDGLHKPIIQIATFKRAQQLLCTKANTKAVIHDFTFRKRLTCFGCNYKLIGERQKGRVYYRCHTKECETKSIREDVVERYIRNALKASELHPCEFKELKHYLDAQNNTWDKQQAELNQSINLKLGALEKRYEKLTDALIDSIIDDDVYEIRKHKILAEKRELYEQQQNISQDQTAIRAKLQKFLELAKSIIGLYDLGNSFEKRELLEIVTSNLRIDRHKAYISMVSPFLQLLNRHTLCFGEANKAIPRFTTREIIYTDKNTSPIIPKPLKGKKLKRLFDLLLEQVALLPDFNIPEPYVFTSNDTCTKSGIRQSYNDTIRS